MTVKVTVIVPVYKVEQYLKRCVDSILKQTVEKIEVILVDDGSPDTCPVICDEIAKKDDRVRVVHKKWWVSISEKCRTYYCKRGVYRIC